MNVLVSSSAENTSISHEEKPGFSWISRRLQGDFSQCFTVAIAWQLLFTIFGRLIQLAFSSEQIYEPFLGKGFLSHTIQWDGIHFVEVTQGAYATIPWEPAFYPLFPLCVVILQKVSFGLLTLAASGLVVNTIATGFALTALVKITRYFTRGENSARLAIIVLLTAPPAFFLHEFYSEAVFIALGFWAYLFALRRSWLWMGLCLIPLTAGRVTAVLFVGLCFLEFWRAKQWRWRGLLSWPMLWFPASILGLLGYSLYLYLLINDPLGMFHAYHYAWEYHVFNINFIHTLLSQVSMIFHGVVFGRVPNHGWTGLIVDQILPVTALGLLVLASGYLLAVLKKDGIPLAVFGFFSVIMLTLNSNTISVYRYILPCLGIYIAVALWNQRRPELKPLFYGFLYLSVITQTFLFIRFVRGIWAG